MLLFLGRIVAVDLEGGMEGVDFGPQHPGSAQLFCVMEFLRSSLLRGPVVPMLSIFCILGLFVGTHGETVREAVYVDAPGVLGRLTSVRAVTSGWSLLPSAFQKRLYCRA